MPHQREDVDSNHFDKVRRFVVQLRGKSAGIQPNHEFVKDFDILVEKYANVGINLGGRGWSYMLQTRANLELVQRTPGGGLGRGHVMDHRDPGFLFELWDGRELATAIGCCRMQPSSHTLSKSLPDRNSVGSVDRLTDA
jgi:hypothetical protein